MNEVKAEYRLTFGVNINIETANNLRSRIATILERGDFGSLTILFSSEGGSTDHSLELFNFISQLPIAIHMHGMGHIGSSAVPVFLAGTRRTCSPFGRFFFHQYDWGFAERQTLHRIDEAVKRLRSDINMARQIIQSRTDIPKDVLDSLEGGTAPTIIEPARAKVLRIIDDVCELPKTGNDGMKVYLECLILHSSIRYLFQFSPYSLPLARRFCLWLWPIGQYHVGNRVERLRGLWLH